MIILKLLKSQNKQNTALVATFKFRETVQKAIYLIDEIIAQKWKHNTVGKYLIIYVSKIIVEEVLEEFTIRKIKTIKINFKVSVEFL